MTARIPCPFVYSDGRACAGHIVRIETYKADVTWELAADGGWLFDLRPRMHYHLFCSERGNHAGFKRQDDWRMKAWFKQLPEELQRLIGGTAPPRL